MPWKLIFIVAAVILFALAAFNVPSPKVQLGWLGAAFAALYVLIS